MSLCLLISSIEFQYSRVLHNPLTLQQNAVDHNVVIMEKM